MDNALLEVFHLGTFQLLVIKTPKMYVKQAYEQHLHIASLFN
jgi:hypothetical protein